jgi:hypothetical protein
VPTASQKSRGFAAYLPAHTLVLPSLLTRMPTLVREKTPKPVLAVLIFWGVMMAA